MNPNLLSMAGRVALVTGAGQGIGRQVALHFASHDAHAVIVNGFYPERAEKTAQEVRALGVAALSLPFDVTDYEQVAAAFDRVRADYQQLHVLVNNAGNAGPGGRPDSPTSGTRSPVTGSGGWAPTCTACSTACGTACR